MDIEWVAIDDVKENKRNPRKISEPQFAKLVESIKEDPEMLEVRPLAIDSDNVVYGGNMRLKALRHLGHTKVPVVRIPDDWDEQKKKRFVIKDNVEFGIWDFDILTDDYELSDLMSWGLDGQELGSITGANDDEEFNASRQILEIVPPEYPPLKERVQIEVSDFSEFEKIKSALKKCDDPVEVIKKALGI